MAAKQNNKQPEEIGVVKFFHRMKGWGFITAQKDGEELFVHYSALEGEGYRNLWEGQTVRFTRHDTDKGLQARNVRVVG